MTCWERRKARASRTPNDGLRLALTLLDSKYREPVSVIMSNRKDRIQTDINGDHVLHFFEKILTESFQNPSYSPPQPARSLLGDIDVEEYSMWDPDDPRIFEVNRTATWLAETWKVYVKRKHKTALDRWNKETGGGNGQPWSFVNYCDKDARWLVVVFLKDVQANYLLAANAGGRMPTHLQMESGFNIYTDVSSLGNSSDQDQSKSSDQQEQSKSSDKKQGRTSDKKGLSSHNKTKQRNSSQISATLLYYLRQYTKKDKTCPKKD